jgi:hypothetical protein
MLDTEYRNFMKQLIFLCMVCIGVAITLLLAPDNAHGANFNLAFDTHYTFSEDGRVSVKKKIKLLNLTTSAYPGAYFVDLPPDAESVVAFDASGKTETSIIEEDGKRKAKIDFNQEPIGFGKEAGFVLSYDTTTLVKKENGKIQINIPGFSTDETITEYTVTVTFPESWGEPKRMIPPPDTKYVWNFSERTEGPVTIDFEEKLTPTVTQSPHTPVSRIPIGIGVTVGAVLFVVLFELVKRRL